MPEHDVVITSDCRGENETARYHFEAFDFETSCSGGLLTGSCNTTIGEGVLVSGNVGAIYLRLTGTDTFGASRYESEIVPAGHSASEYKVFDPKNRPVWCGWHVTEDLEREKQEEGPCFYADCSAEIEIRR